MTTASQTSVLLNDSTVDRLNDLRVSSEETIDSVVSRVLETIENLKIKATTCLSSKSDDQMVAIDFKSPLSIMTHTRVKSAVFHDAALATKLFSDADTVTPEDLHGRPTWNGLVIALLLRLKEQDERFNYGAASNRKKLSQPYILGKDPTALCEWLRKNSVGGNISPIPAGGADANDTRLWYEVPGMGIRFQGLSAPQAWRSVRAILTLMNQYGESTHGNRASRRHGGVSFDLCVEWTAAGTFPAGQVGLMRYDPSGSLSR